MKKMTKEDVINNIKEMKDFLREMSYKIDFYVVLGEPLDKDDLRLLRVHLLSISHFIEEVSDED